MTTVQERGAQPKPTDAPAPSQERQVGSPAALDSKLEKQEEEAARLGDFA